MGIYLNPGNRGFATVRKGHYVDKSGMIRLINAGIGTVQKLTCVSRPRRFGKSFAAKMLCAYYDKTCDSASLFDDLEIAGAESYQLHRNQYDVIYLDMTNIMGKTEPGDMISFIQTRVTEELLQAYPNLQVGKAFDESLLRVTELTGNPFIVIIDEWDAPIRETPEMEKEYLYFLRTLFKSSGTTDRIFAAAYMTGILPIKKDGSQSAISDFEEITMVKPGVFAPYVGFTGEEVEKLCRDYGVDFSEMKRWYDGYSFREAESIYNPNSVMKAIRNRDFDSYWTQSSAAESLMGYINLDFDGLSKTITDLIGGVEVGVNTKAFANDLVSFRNKDDVLTLLIHLGYLAYEEESGRVRIPNQEIRLEFSYSIRVSRRDETIRRVRESDQLIYDTVHGNAQAVADQIEKIHGEEAPLYYNSEQALRSVVKRAYFSYADEYLRFEELPAGVGYADLVYLPRKSSPLPALVIELKWKRSAQGALAQIKHRHYPDAIRDYGGEILLVGINYDKDAAPGERKHTCIIERLDREGTK